MPSAPDWGSLDGITGRENCLVMGNNIISILYYLLVISCVLISVYLSYYGYLSSFSDLALPFTVIIGIGLLGSDILIQRRKVDGRSLFTPLLLFALFSFFSAVSNFNFLYTNFMEDDVVKQTLDRQYSIFRDDLVDTRDKLLQLDSYRFTEEKRVELDRELARLRTQINDSLRPGCGERCRLHISKIEEILGKPMTELAIPARQASLSTVNDWYDRVRIAALADFQTITNTNEFPRLEALLAKINALLLEYDDPQRSLARNVGLPVLRTLSEESKEVQRQSNALFPDNEKIKHTEIDVTLGRLGEIVYSLENGLVQAPNLGASIMSALLSIVIDIFPVFFALVAFSSDTGRIQKRGNRRGRAGTVLD